MVKGSHFQFQQGENFDAYARRVFPKADDRLQRMAREVVFSIHTQMARIKVIRENRDRAQAALRNIHEYAPESQASVRHEAQEYERVFVITRRQTEETIAILNRFLGDTSREIADLEKRRRTIRAKIDESLRPGMGSRMLPADHAGG